MILTGDTIFKSTLDNYKNSLLSLYEKKTIALAERETSRFRYLSAYRFDLESMMSLVRDKVYSSENPLASAFLSGVLNDITFRSILMINQNGSVPAYNAVASQNYAGYSAGSELLKPMNVLLPRIDQDLNSGQIVRETKLWISPSAHQNIYGAIYSGFLGSVPPPYSLEAIITCQENLSHTDSDENKTIAAEIVLSALNDKTLSGSGFSLVDVILEGKNLLIDVFQKTGRFTQLHEEIKGAETALSQFIEAAKANGEIDPSASFSDIYKALMDSKAVTEAVEEEIKLEEMPVVATQIVEAQPKKSGFSIPLALAAIGIFAVTRGE